MKMHNSRKLWGGLAGGLILAIAGPAGIAVGHDSHPVGEASHPEVGALFGTVTDAETGVPLDGVCVAVEHRWRSWDRDRTWTTGGGHYFFNDLRPGAQIIRLDPNCPHSRFNGRYAAEWFDDGLLRRDATLIKIVANETTVVDVGLEEAGALEVSVTDAAGAEVDTCMSLYPGDIDRFDVSAPDRVYNRSDSVVALADVVNGEARVRSVRPGTYRLLVGCLGWQGGEGPAPYGYIPRWSAPFEVTEHVTSSVDTVLVRAGVISGPILDQAGLKVSARIETYETAAQQADTAYAVNGHFTTGRLSAGTYRLKARSWYYWGSFSYFSEWFDDHAGTFSAATPIVVSAGLPARIEVEVFVESPDYAVTDLQVSDPEIETAFGSAPAIGVRKDISVTVLEQGNYPYGSTNRMCLWAESRSSSTSSSRTLIAAETLTGREIRTPKTFSYSWTPAVAIGDLRIRAEIRYGDGDPTNDERVLNTYVAVGGAGGVVASGASYLPPILFGYGYC
jgi:hypothetical protein